MGQSKGSDRVTYAVGKKRGPDMSVMGSRAITSSPPKRATRSDSAQQLRHDLGDLLKSMISRQVTVRVVILLEAVHIYQEQG